MLHLGMTTLHVYCLCVHKPFLSYLNFPNHLKKTFSSEIAVSSLMLLHMSPLMMSGSMPGSEKPASGLPHAMAKNEQVACLHQ